MQCGEADPDLYFVDRPREGRAGQRNREYISFFADEEPVLRGRTPLQCYADFMRAFRCLPYNIFRRKLRHVSLRKLCCALEQVLSDLTNTEVA